MTDRPGQETSLADLREELAGEFVRVAREEPRSRLRRRLRYLGAPIASALLVVPAAVAISGSTDGRDPDDATRTLVGRDCLEPTPLRRGEAYAIPATPPLGLLRRRGPAARDLRDFLGVDARPSHVCPLEVPMRAPGLRAAVPMIDEGARRGESPCVQVQAPARPDERLRSERCVFTLDEALGAPAPAALRSDCLTITASGRGQLEARACDRPAEPEPTTRFRARP